MMQFYGINTVKREGLLDKDTPDSRNDEVGLSGVKTRKGMQKFHNTGVGSGIANIFNIKSDDCKNNYKIVMTMGGSVIVDPTTYIPIPHNGFIVGFWMLDDIQTIIDIPQADNIVAFWQMDDSA